MRSRPRECSANRSMTRVSRSFRSPRSEAAEVEAETPKETAAAASAWPASRPAYVITAGEVKWKPAYDLNRIVLGWQFVAAPAVLVCAVVLDG